MSMRLSAARIALALLLLAPAVPAAAQDGVPAGAPAAPASVPTSPAPEPGAPAGETPAPVPGAVAPLPPAGQLESAPSSAGASSPGVAPSAQAPTGDAPVPGAGSAPFSATPALGEGTPAGEGPAAGSGAPIGAAAAPAGPASIDPALPHDLSPWGMFLAADWVVKAVMIGLVFASLVTWTVWLAKALELSVAKSRARRQVRRLEEAGSLQAALSGGRRPLTKGPVATLARSAAAEAELSGALPAEGVKERVAVALQRIEARSGRHMARGTGLLATIGSTAPFVGLFGTVWGIMNSFIGIAETNTTNLAIVAPGIAEALLATGIGLVAAIPAVIIYNVFARSIAGYRAILADGSAAVLRHLSRDLDRRDAGYGTASVSFHQPAE